MGRRRTRHDHEVVREYVVYARARADGRGHPLRTTDPWRGWCLWRAFLDQWADAEPPSDVRIGAAPPTVYDDEAGTIRVLHALVDAFGPPTYDSFAPGLLRVGDDRDHHTTAPPLEDGTPRVSRFGGVDVFEHRSYTWHVAPGDLETVVTTLAGRTPHTPRLLGPALLSWRQSFRWRESPLLPPLQELPWVPASECFVMLARRPSCIPTLIVPFPEGAPGLDRFVAALAPSLPFHLKPMHWRAVTLRDGRLPRSRPLTIPVGRALP